jgi:hypothetical protein
MTVRVKIAPAKIVPATRTARASSAAVSLTLR